MVYETVLIVALALFALLVGVAIPVLFQLRRTLQSAQTFFESTGSHADAVLNEVSEATQRLTRITEAVETAGRRLGSTLDTVRSLARTAAALGPAAVAAVNALLGASAEGRGSRRGPPERDPHASAPPSRDGAAAREEVGTR